MTVRQRIRLTGALSVILVMSSPGMALAAGFAYPVASVSVNSWFDHEGPFNCLFSCSSSDYMTRYDGARANNANTNVGNCPTMCYNGHNGIDFHAQLGTNLLA